MLFLETFSLGWKTWAQHLEKAAEACDAIDAVHFRVAHPTWMRILTRPLPRPIGRSLVTPDQIWNLKVRRRFSRSIAGGEYRAVVVGSQGLAPPLMKDCAAARVPLVVAMDTTGPIYFRDLLRHGVPPGQTWETERALYRSAALLAPWSNWVGDSLVADFQVERSKILVTPPAVVLPPLTERKPESGRMPRLLFVGNDWDRKGGPQLLAWHQRLWKDRAELHVVSAKAPVDRGAVNVVWHGQVPHQRVLGELLPAADIFCLPTRHDMSPFAVAEAQAAGLPAVSSRLAGLPDLVIDGESGYLLKHDDEAGFIAAIGKLLDDASLRLRMGMAARRHAESNLDAAVVFPRLLERVAALALAGTGNEP